MNNDALPWLVVGVGAAGFGLVVAFGDTWGSIVLLAIFGGLVFLGIANSMRSPKDSDWIVKWISLAYAAKLVATGARYFMVAVLYGGGDSYRYYRVGSELSLIFREGRIPEFTEAGAFGTQVVEFITGGLFAIFTPDMLGGFLMFSMLSFGGQLMMYAAFRLWAPASQLKPYALLIFFLPTYAFWPSSIGKDALVVFAVGGAAYFISRTLRAFQIRWLVGLACFLAILGFIRIHVAGLVVIGLIGAGFVARMPTDAGPAAPIRRLIILGGFVGAGVLTLTLFPDVFGVDLTGADSIDSFAADIVRRTSEKGTVASGGPVTGPEDIPGALALVLFRPFAFEASELQHFFATAETTLLLGLTIWKLPSMLRNRKRWRANGYLVFCTFYTLGFSVAFSVVRNLGIIARQRGQVLAFFLVFLVTLGWPADDESTSGPTAGRPSSRSQRPQPAPPRLPAR